MRLPVTMLPFTDQSGPSMRMRLASWVVRWWRDNTDLEQVRRERRHRDYPQPADMPRRLHRLADVHQTDIDGYRVFRITPQESTPPWHLLYTHGGGYIHALSEAHWDILAALLDATNCTITVPIYPLTPEHTYRDAYRCLTSVYRQLLETTSPDHICLIGDSAGAGLAVGQALHYRQNNLPLPGALVLFSPWLDVTLSHPDVSDVQARDPMLAANWLREVGRWWAGDDDPQNPLVSPVFGELTGLPDTQIHIGTHDLLLPDTRRFADRAKDSDVDIELFEYPGAFHDFMAATFTPEAKQTYHRVAEFLRRRHRQETSNETNTPSGASFHG